MAIIVKGGGGKPEEEKTVTAGTSAIVVLPSSGKTMKKVTINPTPTESKSVIPTTSELTVTPSEGKHLSQVVVGAVEDVTPEVTAQTPVITQIAENLGVTITTPSGTNKQILQGNNTNLLNIKNNAKKEGLYVWKKYSNAPSETISFTWLSGGSSTILQVNSNEVDLTKVTSDFFIGMTGTYSVNGSGSYSYEFTSSSSVKLNGTARNFTYNSSTRQLAISLQTDSVIAFSSVTKNFETTFFGYIVSDSPTAYPDGGEQGGYWYEKMVERLTPEMFGCTKMAIDKFTPTSNIDLYSTYYLNHSLGEVPKFAIILSTEFSNDSNTYYLTRAFNYNNVANCIIICANNRENKDGNISSGLQITDSTKVSCTSKFGGNLKAGIEYTLITMA